MEIPQPTGGPRMADNRNSARTVYPTVDRLAHFYSKGTIVLCPEGASVEQALDVARSANELDPAHRIRVGRVRVEIVELINPPVSAARTLHELKGDGGPAFQIDHWPCHFPGMTLRDWFAGQALAGLLARRLAEGMDYETVARDACAYAAAMVAERAK